jgi:hypothetical protein
MMVVDAATTVNKLKGESILTKQFINTRNKAEKRIQENTLKLNKHCV